MVPRVVQYADVSKHVLTSAQQAVLAGRVLVFPAGNRVRYVNFGRNRGSFTHLKLFYDFERGPTNVTGLIALLG
jgi:hypothetical protein